MYIYHFSIWDSSVLSKRKAVRPIFFQIEFCIVFFCYLCVLNVLVETDLIPSEEEIKSVPQEEEL